MFRMTRIACGALVALATAPTVRAAPIELVQAGDAEMTCPALAAEMNALSAARAKAAKRAESGRKLLGFASTALQIAGSSGVLGKGGGGGQGNYAAQQALGSLQAQAQQQQVMAAQQQMLAAATQGLGGYGGSDPSAAAPSAPPADASVEAQRLARLTELHAQKGC
jgi:hypothetical protein